jgi:hypothetical protein
MAGLDPANQTFKQHAFGKSGSAGQTTTIEIVVATTLNCNKFGLPKPV